MFANFLPRFTETLRILSMHKKKNILNANEGNTFTTGENNIYIADIANRYATSRKSIKIV